MGRPATHPLSAEVIAHKLLETGSFATIEEIADAENINPSYVSRVLRLTLLAPAIVEAILDAAARLFVG